MTMTGARAEPEQPPRRPNPMPKYGNAHAARGRRPCSNPLPLRLLVKAARFVHDRRPTIIVLEDGTCWG